MRETSQSKLTQPDPRSSMIWLQLETAFSAEAMQNMQGVWYSETTSPDGLYVQHLYYSFEPGGLFQYKDDTCTAGTNYCSHNGGPGHYRASQQGNGSTFYMIRFSDLIRTNQCRSGELRFQDNQTMVTPSGGVWKRVQ